MKKPIILELPRCGKCGKILELQFTTEQEEDSSEGPKVLIMFGKCEECKTITLCGVVEFKDIPKEEGFIKTSKEVKEE